MRDVREDDRDLRILFSYIAPEDGNASRESDNGGERPRLEGPLARKCGIVTAYGTYGPRGTYLS